MFPNYFKRKLGKRIVKWVRDERKKESAKIPKISLNEIAIRNAKLLIDRERLLEYLPKNGNIAEIGVDKGEFSELILKKCNPKKFHLVDVWATQEYNENKKKLVEGKFNKEIESGVLEINHGYSFDVGLNFQDGYFDWIYLDTDHTYQTTIKELEVYRSKIKPGGIISGHDFIVGFWDGMIRYGVMEAVYEFCKKYNWEIIYITMEINSHPSFAIRKIEPDNF